MGEPVISIDDFLVFCRRTTTAMVAVADRLGDDLVNRHPELPGANTPYQLVNHAVGAVRWWCSHVVLGHPSDRVRADEFVARGTVGELNTAVAELLATLEVLAPELAGATRLAGPATTETPLEGEWTVGAALLHAYEELAQHLGHLEVTADVLLAGG